MGELKHAIEIAAEALKPFEAVMPGFDALAAREGEKIADDDAVVLSHGLGSLEAIHDLRFADFRRAAEVFRALSPGGAV